MQPEYAHVPAVWHVHDRAPLGGTVFRDSSIRGEAWIYHRLPWPHAQSIFEMGRLRLSPVHSWKDPYEKWWCDVLFGRIGPLAGVRAYGLCWTSSQYDEPAWRMAGYGKKEPIVRIRCRVDSLLEAGRKLIENKPGALFLGRVRYSKQKALLDVARSVVADSNEKLEQQTAGTLLLHKRNAFRFEREVRLLWLDRAADQAELFLPIDRLVTIAQVMTSPYATDDENQMVRNSLVPYGIRPLRSAVLRRPALL